MTARLITIACAAAALLCGAALAQTPAPPPAAAKSAPVYVPTSLAVDKDTPRGADGKPDLGGFWESPYIGGLVSIPFVTPASLVITDAQSKTAHQTMMNAMASLPALSLDPEIVQLIADTHGFPVVRGQRRSRLLVLPADGKMPITAAANAEIAKAGVELMSLGKTDNPEERPGAERCIDMSSAPPMQAPNAFGGMQIVQTKSHLALVNDGSGDARIIPFSKVHGPAELGQPFGDSIAWWEGDTLVIETVAAPASKRLRVTAFGGGLVVNNDAKVIERITRVSRQEVIYQFTVEDPKVYTAPWLGEFSMYRSDYAHASGACHEANYAMANILSGARYEDRFPPVAWDANISATVGDVRWTNATKSAAEARSWAVLARKDASGQGRVALRIERAYPTSVSGALPSLSEMNVFAVDCTGQRLKMLSLTTYAARNLGGEKSERPPTGDWVAAANRPNLAAGVREACA